MTYTIDDVAPTIVATVSPLANANGWHGTPVTVTFECNDANLASCPSPTTVSQEGVGLLVSGTATDEAGHSVSTSVTLNVDLTPPTTTLTTPTENGTTSATTIDVSGVVADAGSGLAYVACNGVVATVTGDAASCTVPLKPGRNGVVLVARDAAGNVMSAGVDITRAVTPTVLRLSPSNRTLLVGETVSLSLTDDAGLAVVEATWTSSDPGTATISTDPYPVVTAMGAGTTTLTASKNGMTAQAVITVAAGPTLADGTVRWTLSPSASFAVDKTFYASPVAVSVADLFVAEVIDENTANEQYTILGVTADGTVQWRAAAPGRPVLADTFGGVVTLVRDGTDKEAGLARLGGPASAPPWRYDTDGDFYGPPAQAPDGTLYIIEHFYSGGVQSPGYFLTAFDGQTGQVRARTLIPQSVVKYDCPEMKSIFTGRVTMPVIGSDGRAYIQVAQLQRTSGSLECSRENWVDDRLLLLGMDAAGATTTQTVFQSDVEDEPFPDKTMPDGLRGMLVKWATASQTTLTRFSETGARVDNALIQNGLLLLTGTDSANDHATAYVRTGEGTLRALDVETLGALWTANIDGEPLAAGLDRGVIVDTSTGLMTLDGTGQVVTTAPPLGLLNAVQSRFGLWTGHAPALARAGELEARVSTPFNEVPLSFAQGVVRGNNSGQNAARFNVFSTREKAALAALDFIYPVSTASNWEWGGRICQQANGFVWSRILTDHNQSSVTLPLDLCGPMGVRVASYHVHPPIENAEPSGGDIINANTEAGEPRYLRAPIPNSPVQPPIATWTLKFWRSTSRLAQQNICRLTTDNVWVPYTPTLLYPGTADADCATPTP